MNIQYTEKKIFTAEQVEELFLSVKWISGKYPDRLYRALLWYYVKISDNLNCRICNKSCLIFVSHC